MSATQKMYDIHAQATGTMGAFAAMAWGSLGVVYGDLGENLSHCSTPPSARMLKAHLKVP